MKIKFYLIIGKFFKYIFVFNWKVYVELIRYIVYKKIGFRDRERIISVIKKVLIW